jgi:hypothetical protein
MGGCIGINRTGSDGADDPSGNVTRPNSGEIEKLVFDDNLGKFCMSHMGQGKQFYHGYLYCRQNYVSVLFIPIQ